MLFKSRPKIIITAGDPAGIGPEITKKAISQKDIKNLAEFIIVGDIDKKYPYIGHATAEGGRISVENIKKAVKILRGIKGKKALVTCPINKYSIKEAGFGFNGHTEMLAGLTKTKDVAMSFIKDYFRIVLVTRHIPLSKAASEISEEKIIRTTKLFYQALNNFFKIKKPRIGIAGLNPHAGESGIMGREETDIIIPAVRRLKIYIKNIIGPKPADIIFNDLYKRNLDGVVCMYHDQGLIPFKMLYFDKGVNLTLGLPFIRTSPDHGTAYDIAGKNIADASSMCEAIKLAIKLA